MSEEPQFWMSDGINNLIDGGQLESQLVAKFAVHAKEDFRLAGSQCRTVEIHGDDRSFVVHTEQDFCSVWLRHEYALLMPGNLIGDNKPKPLPEGQHRFRLN